ncbi:MAG TPA: DUF4157 domain-containing protein [Kofleriaceae bacterium]|nr:DUF4157 domain-containing protein [Kofleriaceae bacterium]
MRDPHDEAESSADETELPAEGAAQEPGRPALSDEIARRWDPRRLMRMVKRGAGRGEPLDAATRSHFERRLGADLGGVRVYSGEFAEKVTAQHSAEAVTVGGTGMIFMSGSPDRSPVTARGRSLLAHELTHVAQSSRGVYRSAPGERPPLATEENEAEAEAVEADEERRAGGGADKESPDPVKMQEDLHEAVASRVLDLVYEDERVHEVRNGQARMRP